jgi:hypothetical protein
MIQKSEIILMNLTFAASGRLEQHHLDRVDVKQSSNQKRCLSARLSVQPVIGALTELAARPDK